jgi:hypothetical protein
VANRCPPVDRGTSILGATQERLDLLGARCRALKGGSAGSNPLGNNQNRSIHELKVS